MTKGLLEKQVRAVLKGDEASRNDDIRLTQVLWYRFYREHIHEHDGVFYVRLNALHTLPREDHISRIRRKVQNDCGDYVPTDKAVALKRGFSTDEWYKYLGYSV